MKERIENAMAAGHQVFEATIGSRRARFINPLDTCDTTIMLCSPPAEMSKRDFHRQGWSVDCQMNSITSISSL